MLQPSDNPTPTHANPQIPTQAQASVAAIRWLNQHRQKISLGFGGVLVGLALLVAFVFPPLVPRPQRLDVFMLSFALGILGTGSLFAGMLPKQKPATKAELPTTRHINTKKIKLTEAQRALLVHTRTKTPMKVYGIALGTLLFLAGVFAPFVLGQANADERFLMMIGFAPVAVIGMLLIIVFWRGLGSSPKNTVNPPKPATSKTIVTRAPEQAAFKWGVPIAIYTALALLIVVIVVVIVATILPILNR